METSDAVISLDLSPNDCLYRIRRDAKDTTRVVYVVLKDLDIIAEESQTYGPEVIRELSKIDDWYKSWRTLVVYKDDTGIQSQADVFEPHGLSEQQIVGDYEFVGIHELRFLQELRTRVFRVEKGDIQCFLKIARFGFELNWLAQEIKTYHVLTQRHSTLAPRILGYVFEDSRDRVIGFIFEEIIGRRPCIADLQVCETALQELHDLDIIHGDINRHNVFVTDDGAKFIDFEDSCIGPVGEAEDWKTRKADEMQSLPEKLSDESGRGRPWTSDDYPEGHL